MKMNPSRRTGLLFFLFFLFQWGGQLSAAAASGAGGKAAFFLIPLYLCFLFRGFIWLFILRDMKLGLAYSLSSLGYLVIPFLSRILLGEPFRGSFIPGGLLILAGITLYGRAEQKLAEQKRADRLPVPGAEL